MVQTSEEIGEMVNAHRICGKKNNCNNITFKEKMNKLTDKLYKQIKESNELDEAIKANLEELGYEE
ncbi:hypothetical protein ACJDU8_11030 [Clostridium sp. WILCCON 0269]|uniref:Site-specific DNA-methyltransferase (adenine-specific) n=1 Tax=Candidatus Clostridium eludens TaxID=3381663 RepID=A0ABW8SMW7_9CLOT